jgi:hypothetical protein
MENIQPTRILNDSEVQAYKNKFKSLEQIEKEQRVIQSCLINSEMLDLYTNTTKEQQQQIIAKFTQLFKALLEVKDKFTKKPTIVSK